MATTGNQWRTDLCTPDGAIEHIGTQAEQKKFIGNAVEVNMSRVLCEALARKLMDKAS